MLGDPLKKPIIKEIVERTLATQKDGRSPLSNTTTNYSLGDISVRNVFASITSVPTEYPKIGMKTIRIDSFLKEGEFYSKTPQDNYFNQIHWEEAISELDKGRGPLPPPGIKEVSTRYLGDGALLGTTKQAEVQISVHSNTQYNVIVPAFVRIGKPIMLQYGYMSPSIDALRVQAESSLKFYYDNRTDEEKESNPEDFKYELNKDEAGLYPERLSLATRGNLDCMLGNVSNYDLSLNSMGGYDITLTITSVGHSVYSQDFTSDTIPRITTFTPIQDTGKVNNAPIDADPNLRLIDRRGPLVLLAKYREIIQEDFSLLDTFKVNVDFHGATKNKNTAIETKENVSFFASECPSYWVWAKEALVTKKEGSKVVKRGGKGLTDLAEKLSESKKFGVFMPAGDDPHHLVAVHRSRDLLLTCHDYTIDGHAIWAESVVGKFAFGNKLLANVCPINYYVSMRYIEDNILSRLFGTADLDDGKIVSGIRSLFYREAPTEDGGANLLRSNKMLLHEYMVPKNMFEVIVNSPQTIALLNDSKQGGTDNKLKASFAQKLLSGTFGSGKSNVTDEEIRLYRKTLATALVNCLPFQTGDFVTKEKDSESEFVTPNLKECDYRNMYVNLDVLIKAFVGDVNDAFIHKNFFPSELDYKPDKSKDEFNLWELFEDGIKLDPTTFVETFKQGMDNFLNVIKSNFYNYPQFNLGTNPFLPNFASVYDGRYSNSQSKIFTIDTFSKHSIVKSVDLKSNIPSTVELAATLGASSRGLPLNTYNSHMNSAMSTDLLHNYAQGEQVLTDSKLTSAHTIQFPTTKYFDIYDNGASPMLATSKNFNDTDEAVEAVDEMIETDYEDNDILENMQKALADEAAGQGVNGLFNSAGSVNYGANHSPKNMRLMRDLYLFGSPEDPKKAASEQEIRNATKPLPLNPDFSGEGLWVAAHNQSGRTVDAEPFDINAYGRRLQEGNATSIVGPLLPSADSPPSPLNNEMYFGESNSEYEESELEAPKGNPDMFDIDGNFIGQTSNDPLYDGGSEGYYMTKEEEEVGLVADGVIEAPSDAIQVQGVNFEEMEIVSTNQTFLYVDGDKEKSVFSGGLSTSVIKSRMQAVDEDEDDEGTDKATRKMSFRQYIGTLGRQKTNKGVGVEGEYADNVDKVKYRKDVGALLESIATWVEANSSINGGESTIYQTLRETTWDILDVKTKNHGPGFLNDLKVQVGQGWEDFVEFLMYQADNHSLQSLASTLSYFELSLTMDGIAGIMPGQSFSVSYLPDFVKKNFYFIVKGINQTLGPDGWETTIEGLQKRRLAGQGLSTADDYVNELKIKTRQPVEVKNQVESAGPPRPDVPEGLIPPADNPPFDSVLQGEPTPGDEVLGVPPDLEQFNPEPLEIRNAPQEPIELPLDMEKVESSFELPPQAPNPWIPYHVARSRTARLVLSMNGRKPNIDGLENGPQQHIVLFKDGRPASDPHYKGNMKTSFGVTDVLRDDEYERIKKIFMSTYNLQQQIVDDYMADLYELRRIEDRKPKWTIKGAIRNYNDRKAAANLGDDSPWGNPAYDEGPGHYVDVYIRKDSEVSDLIKDLEELQKDFIGNDPTNITDRDNNYIDDILADILYKPNRTRITAIPMGKPEPETLPPAEDIADEDKFYDEYQQGTEEDQEEALESQGPETINTYGLNLPEPEPIPPAAEDPPPAEAEPVVEPITEYVVTKSREQFLSEARAVIGYAGVAVYDPRAYMAAVQDGNQIATSDAPGTDPILNDPKKARQELEKQGKWNGGVYNLLLQRNPNASADHSDAVDFDYMNGLLKKALTTEQDARIYTQTFLKTIQLGDTRFKLNATPDNYRGEGSRPIKLQDYSNILIYTQMVGDAKKIPCNDGTTFKSSQGDISETLRAKYYCHANNQFAQKFKACYKKFPNLRPAT